MNTLSKFLKKNQIRKENIFYPATASLKDENGEPLLWELKALSSNDVKDIYDSYENTAPGNGIRGNHRQGVNSGFLAKICAASVVFPDLYNAELQDSYGVATPQDLLMEMVNHYGEFKKLAEVIIDLSGLADNLSEDIEQAKN